MTQCGEARGDFYFHISRIFEIYVSRNTGIGCTSAENWPKDIPCRTRQVDAASKSSDCADPAKPEQGAAACPAPAMPLAPSKGHTGLPAAHSPYRPETHRSTGQPARSPWLGAVLARHPAKRAAPDISHRPRPVTAPPEQGRPPPMSQRRAGARTALRSRSTRLWNAEFRNIRKTPGPSAMSQNRQRPPQRQQRPSGAKMALGGPARNAPALG